MSDSDGSGAASAPGYLETAAGAEPGCPVGKADFYMGECVAEAGAQVFIPVDSLTKGTQAGGPCPPLLTSPLALWAGALTAAEDLAALAAAAADASLAGAVGPIPAAVGPIHLLVPAPEALHHKTAPPEVAEPQGAS